ncbi:MAG: cell division FtsA domain-containing protein [Marinifilaceae bacterium]
MSLVASLDMGANKMAMALASYNEEGVPTLLNIKIIASNGMRDGIVIDKSMVSDNIRTMLSELVKNKSVDTIQVALSGSALMQKRREVSLNLPRHIVERRDLELAGKQCDDAIDYKDEELVDKIVISYNIDGDDSVTDPLGKTGRTLKVLYCQYTAYRDYLNKLRMLFTELGFKRVNFIAQTRAYQEAIFNELERRKVALVDLGDDSIKIAMFNDTLLHHEAILPLGVNTIDLDIAEAYNIDDYCATRLKEDEGNAIRALCKNKKVNIVNTDLLVESKELATIVQSRMEELLTGVAYVLQKSGFKDSVDEILLTGGGCRLCNTSTLMQRLSDCEVSRATLSEFNASREDWLRSPEFFVALGLLKCFETIPEEKENKFSKIFKKLWN